MSRGANDMIQAKATAFNLLVVPLYTKCQMPVTFTFLLNWRIGRMHFCYREYYRILPWLPFLGGSVAAIWTYDKINYITIRILCRDY